MQQFRGLWLRRLWRRKEGVSAVEFGLVAGILAVLLLGILDFGMGFWEQLQVANAARAGAEYAAKNGYDRTNIRTAVSNATSLSGIQASPSPTQTCGCPNATTGVTSQACNTSCPNGQLAGTYVTVNTQVSYRTIFAWPGLPNPITLASTATLRIN